MRVRVARQCPPSNSLVSRRLCSARSWDGLTMTSAAGRARCPIWSSFVSRHNLPRCAVSRSLFSDARPESPCPPPSTRFFPPPSPPPAHPPQHSNTPSWQSSPYSRTSPPEQITSSSSCSSYSPSSSSPGQPPMSYSKASTSTKNTERQKHSRGKCSIQR